MAYKIQFIVWKVRIKQVKLRNEILYYGKYFHNILHIAVTNIEIQAHVRYIVFCILQKLVFLKDLVRLFFYLSDHVI